MFLLFNIPINSNTFVKVRPLLAYIIAVILACHSFSTRAGTKEDDFQKNFMIAKRHLSMRKILKAIPYLEYLQKQYPKNANLNYLIGVCYAEEEIVNPKSIELLNSATAYSSLEYNPNSVFETRVPIYVYYYLCLAYAQNGMCEKANTAREKFISIYPHEDPYYIEESARWIKSCSKNIGQVKLDTLPRFENFSPYTSKELEPKPLVIEDATINEDPSEELEESYYELPPPPKKIITKKKNYSTDYPLYGVQLGAYKEVVPVSRFKELKNVDAFMDKDGLIRYVVGHFSINSQAESLLEAIKQKGYKDAFVVNVNDAKKFSEEVVSVDDRNIRASYYGKVEYKIQLGAFTKEISSDNISMYFKINGIEELHIKEMTYLTAGNFISYAEAKAYLEGIKATGITDAFIIAVNKGLKIPLSEALDYENAYDE